MARAGIGFVPEDRRVFAELTVRENLDVARRAAAAPRPLDGRGGVRRCSRSSTSCASGAPGLLSGGEQQMLTIARTLMCNPELLLLDEPSEGLAPLVVESLLEQVRRLKQEGLTILLAEQGVEFSLALADRVYVLEKGAVVHHGPAAALRDDADVAGAPSYACDLPGEHHAVRHHQDPQGPSAGSARTRCRAA